MKPVVRVPHEWMERSLAWAERSVLGYGNGEKERSRAYARPGIDKSIDAQLLGKAGECGFCLHMGIDPEELDWGPKTDVGWDVKLYARLCVDVKATDTEYLIWPVTKNGFFDRPKAHIYALARRLKPDVFEMSGWVRARYFIQHHKTAPPPTHFDAGTKCMHHSVLWPIEELQLSAHLRGALEGWEIAAVAASDAIQVGKNAEFVTGEWP